MLNVNVFLVELSNLCIILTYKICCLYLFIQIVLYYINKIYDDAYENKI